MTNGQVSGTSQPTLTFFDDFNTFDAWNGSGGTWDTSRWYAPNGVTGYEGELEWYVNPAYAPTAAANPFAVANGNLDITAAPAPASILPSIGGQTYTSGLITTYHSFAQEYGYFEMRAQLPAGQGLWPAFWLLPTDNTWPPELDVAEVLEGNPDLLYTTVHTQTSGTQQIAPDQFQTMGSTAVADTTTGFHTYGVDWEADKITWYFDGKPVFQAATPADMHKPMYMIADLAVGGNWPGAPDGATPFPATMKIDYIRAYSALPVLTPLAVDADQPSATAAWSYRDGDTVTFAGNRTVAGPVALAGTVTMETAAGQAESFTGALSDGASPGYLVKDGAGTLLLSGANTFSGGLLLEGGTLELSGAAAAGTGGIAFAPGAAATLVLDGAQDGFAPAITGFGAGDAIDLTGAAPAGVLVDAVSGAVSGAVSLAGTGATLLLGSGLPGEVLSATDDGHGGTLLTAAVPGTAPGTLTLRVAGDLYQGDPQFVVLVDGRQVGGTFSTHASHGAGQYQDVVVQGDFTAPQQVAVQFINDQWDGTAATDRNLYVEQLSVNGQTFSGGTARNAAGFDTPDTAALLSNGVAVFDTAPAGAAAPLVIGVSEDAYAGDAQFTVSVNGVQQGGIYTATAAHAAGAEQAVVIPGSFGTGPLDVGVTFLNDCWGGSPDTDRNLYVNSITVAGTRFDENFGQYGNGTAHFTVKGGTTYTLGTPDKLTLGVSEDAWQGDAQFTVLVDGVQQGGVRTATAAHAAGQTQLFDVTGSFGAGPHTVGVNFLNDAWGGTPDTDRNLYVDSISFDGSAPQQGMAQYGGGLQTYSGLGLGVENVPGASTTLTATGPDTIQAGPGTAAITLAGPGATVIGGTGTDTVTAVAGTDTILANAATISAAGGTGVLTFVAGSAAATVAAGPGGLRFTAGSGSAAVAAGPGADLLSFVNGTAGGTVTVAGFKLGTDHLHLDGYATGTEAAVLAAASAAGGAATLVLPDQTRIVLSGVTVPGAGLFS